MASKMLIAAWGIQATFSGYPLGISSIDSIVLFPELGFKLMQAGQSLLKNQLGICIQKETSRQMNKAIAPSPTAFDQTVGRTRLCMNRFHTWKNSSLAKRGYLQGLIVSNMLDSVSFPLELFPTSLFVKPIFKTSVRTISNGWCLI